jgi:ribose transport system permease protein
MNTKRRAQALVRLFSAAPLLLLTAVCLLFGLLNPRFFDAHDLRNILVQSSSIAIVAVGMTFVLLTAGVDLSVGSIMFLSAAVAGKIALAGYPLACACGAVLVIGVVFGLMNALLVARFRLLAFIATLATLYLGRGLGLYITETRAMNLPEGLLRLGSGRLLGVPFPLWIVALVLAASHLTLSRTAFGRQIYAAGHNLNAAARAGIRTRWILAWVYTLCGFCAALGGLVAVAQLGAVSPTFGERSEFAAIAAAVLGGTSLFGGRGRVLPGTLLGAVLMQTIQSGLVIVNADPYLYPMVTAAIIFTAVLLDGMREAQLRKASRRSVRGAIVEGAH